MRDGEAGLHIERTALAWTRSVLAALVVCLIVARVTAARSPLAAILLAVGALLAAGAALGRIHGRYRRASAAGTAGRPVGDGRVGAAVVVLVVLLGLGGIVLILTG